MTARWYDYAGTCDDCDRAVRIRISAEHKTSRPDPVKYARCGECSEIVAVEKLSATDAKTGSGGHPA